MTERLDVRGMECPLPIVRIKQAFDGKQSAAIEALTDSESTLQNIERFAANNGLGLESLPSEPGTWLVRLTKRATGASVAGTACDSATATDMSMLAPAIFLTTETIGAESPELGRLLMKAFLKTQIEIAPRPATIVLMHSAVRLACSGSEHLGPLSALVAAGTNILVCGTCLDYFKLRERLEVGRVSNMFELAETLARAPKLIQP